MTVWTMTALSTAALRRIADAPQPVATLDRGTLHKLAAHRAVDVIDGMARITRTGLRQLRNLSA